MKKLIFILLGLMIIISCNKEEVDNSIKQCLVDAETYSNDYGTTLDLDYQSWNIEKNEIGGGSFNVDIAGSTNGDSATIRTFGDGLIVDAPIKLYSSNRFEQSFSISFTATSLPEGDITNSTFIYVFKEQDTLTVNLESCVLRY